MGEISGRLADFTVITTDNPRNENPKEIMSQIEKGIKNTRGLYKIIENRKQAIAFAMKIAWKNDIVLIAGKGHETYQELKNKKRISFDERKVVKEIAEKMALYLIIAFVATLIVGTIIVPILKKFKIGQIVREDGPKSHLKKQGTPIMGGIMMIIVLVVILAFNAIKDHTLILPIVAVLGFGIVGFLDDYKKLVLKNT